MARREATGVRLWTRRGHVWTARYPGIAEAVERLEARSCLIDGEVVICNNADNHEPPIILH
jgi:bifunctional non-homologous end joining protein LigD